MDFIRRSAGSTDLFCFQETFNADKDLDLSHIFPGLRSSIFEELSAVLSDYRAFFSPTNRIDIGGTRAADGLAIFSRKNITIDSEGAIVIFMNPTEKKPLERTKNMQYVRLVYNGKRITLCNIHGTTYPGDKLDTPDRIKQSAAVVDFLSKEEGEKILGGDFNLMPQTESIGMIEASGMADLIKNFKISSTRSDISYEAYSSSEIQQHFADFVFTSRGIAVKGFEAPRLNISDHLPLILDFD